MVKHKDKPVRVVETSEKTDDSKSIISDMTAEVRPKNIITDLESRLQDDSLSRVFHKRRLYGRHEEQATTRGCFLEVIKEETAQLLLISGPSGSGKSAIIEDMRDFVIDHNGFFCAGKFDQKLRIGGTNEPFSALSIAFSEIIDFILNDKDQERLKQRSTAIRDALGLEASSLTSFVSNLSRLIGGASSSIDTTTASYSDHSSGSTEESTGAYSPLTSSTILPILFRDFLHALTSKDAPILLFLDDLQFADADSLDVFRAIATAASLKHVMIVGAFRSTEMSVEELLELNIQSNSIPVRGCLPMTELQIGNLDADALNEALTEMLDLDDFTTAPLSQVILRKSGGNPFYFTQFLNTISEKKLLEYDEDASRWTWDIQRILSSTDISDNVLELVSQRMQRLPNDSNALLTFVSFFGNRFEINTVETVLRRLPDLPSLAPVGHHTYPKILSEALSLIGEGGTENSKPNRFKEVLSEAHRDGLLERCTMTSYKFTHDRIEQVLYAGVLSTTEKAELHYHIGRAMTVSLRQNQAARQSQDDHLLFFVADHLNRGAEFVTGKEVVELAEINYDAGKASASQSAFRSAASFFASAVKLLSDEAYWKTEYKLVLKIHTCSAEMEARIGNHSLAQERCSEILSRATSMDDKLSAHACSVSSYATEESLDDAIQTGTDFLRRVGIKFPKHPNAFHIVVSLIRTKRCLRGVTDSMVMNLPPMSDVKMIKALEVMNQLAITLYFMESIVPIFPLLVFRMVRMILRYGLARTSPVTLAWFGLLNASLGDREQAGRYGRLALALMQSMPDKEGVEAQVVSLVYHFVFTWEKPVVDCIEPFSRSLQIGKQSGDLQWAYNGAVGYLGMIFHSGRPLRETRKVAREVCQEMSEFGLYTIFRLCVPYWQLCDNLMGNGINGAKLTGDVMDEDQILQEVARSQNLIAQRVLRAFQLIAAVFFCDGGKIAELVPLNDEKELDTSQGSSHYWAWLVRGYLGFAYADIYGRTGKRSALRGLKKNMKRLKWWSENRVDCKATLFIVEAELVALTSRKLSSSESIHAAYSKAIEQCQREGCVHYQAFCNERAAIAFNRRDDSTSAASFLSEAQRCYTEWGAHAKLDCMDYQVGTNSQVRKKLS